MKGKSLSLFGLGTDLKVVDARPTNIPLVQARELRMDNYKGKEKKQEAIKECVELARRIPDKGQETFALAGILSFTDKVISEETRQYIKEVVGMTQVGKMLMDEGREEGRKDVNG